MAVPAAVTDPMAMAFASTLLCSQEIHRLAALVNAHQARATGSARQSQEGLGHIIAQVQVRPAAVQLHPISLQDLREQALD